MGIEKVNLGPDQTSPMEISSAGMHITLSDSNEKTKEKTVDFMGHRKTILDFKTEVSDVLTDK
jgi:hypothetical protein